MSVTPIDKLYSDNQRLLEFLREHGEISLLSDVDANFKKVLVLAAASFFEDEIKTILIESARRASNDNRWLVSFLKNKAVERQYHTYFDWERRNANRFLKLFGNEFFEECSNEIAHDDKLVKAIESFMELGGKRNEMAHLNFVVFPLEKTAEECYEMYKQALLFIEYFRKKLTAWAVNMGSVSPESVVG